MIGMLKKAYDKVMPDTRDRRKHPRFPLEVEVHYNLDQNTEAWRPARSGNISEGGMLLQSDARVPEGAPIDIELMIPAIGSFFFTGTVVWSRKPRESGGLPYEQGIQFIMFDSDDRRRWRVVLQVVTEKAES